MESTTPPKLVCHSAGDQQAAKLQWVNKMSRQLAPGFRHMKAKRTITEDSLGAPLQSFFDKYAANAVSAPAQAIVAPWVLRSDADERCEMFPPGWDREPSWMARKSLRD